MISDGDKLIVANDYGKIIILINFTTVLSFVVLFLFVAGSLSHKMIGVEILHSFQLVFLLQALSNNSTPLFGLFKSLSIVSGNFLFMNDMQLNIYSSKYATRYSPTNQDFSEGLIIGASVLLLLICSIPIIWKWTHIFANPQIDPNKFSKVNTFVKVVYTHLLFPIAVGFLMVNLLVVNTIIDGQSVAMFSALPHELSCLLSLITVFISSSIFFFEGKLLLM